MNHPPATPDERFAALIAELLDDPDVTGPSGETQSKRGFGSSALKVRNKICAMLVQGKLVLKLPKERVDALIASGQGEPFEPRHDGRLMKEWIVVEPSSDDEWLALTKEAMAFVASKN